MLMRSCRASSKNDDASPVPADAPAHALPRLVQLLLEAGELLQSLLGEAHLIRRERLRTKTMAMSIYWNFWELSVKIERTNYLRLALVRYFVHTSLWAC